MWTGIPHDRQKRTQSPSGMHDRDAVPANHGWMTLTGEADVGPVISHAGDCLILIDGLRYGSPGILRRNHGTNRLRDQNQRIDTNFTNLHERLFGK